MKLLLALVDGKASLLKGMTEEEEEAVAFDTSEMEAEAPEGPSLVVFEATASVFARRGVVVGKDTLSLAAFAAADSCGGNDDLSK